MSQDEMMVCRAIEYMFSTHYTKKTKKYKDLVRILGKGVDEEMLDSFFKSSQFQKQGGLITTQLSTTDFFPYNKTVYIKPTSEATIDIEMIKNELKETQVVRYFQTKSGFLIEVNNNSIAKRILGQQFNLFSIGKPYSTKKKKLIASNKKKLSKFKFFYETDIIAKESPINNDSSVIKVIRKNRCLLASKIDLSTHLPNEAIVTDEKKKKIIEIIATQITQAINLNISKKKKKQSSENINKY